jgi:hypothetical protein
MVGVFGVGAAALAAIPVEQSATGQSAKRKPASAPLSSRVDTAELARLTAQLSTSANKASALRTQIAQAEAELAKARALRLARAAQAAAQGAGADSGAAIASQAGQASQPSQPKSARPSGRTESDEGDDQPPAPGTTHQDDSADDEGGTHD